MPDNFLSLLDITARRNTDQAVGLVEEVTTYAPELEKVMGRPIPGRFYEARVRTIIPTGGAFRNVNAGAPISSSRYLKKRFDCSVFDAELQVDEAEGFAAEQQGDSLAQLQADEAEGALRNKAIYLGQQFYTGKTEDPNGGFPGLNNFVFTGVGNDPSQSIAAGGSSGSCEVAYFIWMHAQGVHFLFGGNQGIDIKPWQRQQVAITNAAGAVTGHQFAWVSNLVGLIGLSCANIKAVGAVKNIDNTLTNDAEANPLTDKLGWDCFHAFPVGLKPNLCFMSRRTIRGLQKTRSVTLFGQDVLPGAQGIIAPVPTTIAGVPIVVTDSILSGAANPF